MAIMVCGGCISTGRPSAKLSAPTEKQSVYVLGVVPSTNRLTVFPGNTSDGKFNRSKLLPANFYGNPQGGFIVGKAKAGQTLAVIMVRVTANENDILGWDFKPCGNLKTLVFEAPAGKVVYLGSIQYIVNGGDLDIKYSNDLEQARRYLANAYPALESHLEQGSFELLPTSQSCSSVNTIYVPTYTPR